MAMIFMGDEDRAGNRSVKLFNTIEGARTGRWCRANSGVISSNIAGRVPPIFSPGVTRPGPALREASSFACDVYFH